MQHALVLLNLNCFIAVNQQILILSRVLLHIARILAGANLQLVIARHFRLIRSLVLRSLTAHEFHLDLL